MFTKLLLIGSALLANGSVLTLNTPQKAFEHNLIKHTLTVGNSLVLGGQEISFESGSPRNSLIFYSAENLIKQYYYITLDKPLFLPGSQPASLLNEKDFIDNESYQYFQLLWNDTLTTEATIVNLYIADRPLHIDYDKEFFDPYYTETIDSLLLKYSISKTSVKKISDFKTAFVVDYGRPQLIQELDNRRLFFYFDNRLSEDLGLNDTEYAVTVRFYQDNRFVAENEAIVFKVLPNVILFDNILISGYNRFEIVFDRLDDSLNDYEAENYTTINSGFFTMGNINLFFDTYIEPSILTYADGYNDGYDKGFDNGADEGYGYGYSDGYDKGLAEGLAQADGGWLGHLVYGTIGGIVGLLFTISDFEVLGVSIMSIITLFVAIGIIMLLIKVLK